MILRFTFKNVSSAQADFICFMAGLPEVVLQSGGKQGLELTYKVSSDLGEDFFNMQVDRLTIIKKRFNILTIEALTSSPPNAS